MKINLHITAVIKKGGGNESKVNEWNYLDMKIMHETRCS